MFFPHPTADNRRPASASQRAHHASKPGDESTVRLRGIVIGTLAVFVLWTAMATGQKDDPKDKPDRTKSFFKKKLAQLGKKKGKQQQAGKKGRQRDENDKQKSDADKKEDAEDVSLEELPPLPRFEDMEKPSYEQLIKGPPLDWIVLKRDEEVIITSPIYPKPNTLEKIERAARELSLPRPKDAKQREEFKKQREEMLKIEIFLPGETDAPLQKIHIKVIDRIVHHEDLIILRIGQLLGEGQRRKAFELLNILSRSRPDWPGIDQAQNDLLYADALASRSQDDLQRSLMFLEELHSRDRDYPSLKKDLGQVADLLITRADQSQDARRSRHFLRRLSAREKNHKIVAKWADLFLSRSKERLKQAQTAWAAGKYAEAVAEAEQALAIWPETPALQTNFKKFAKRYQELRVGVLSFGNHKVPHLLPTQAEERIRYLTRLAAFEPVRTRDRTYYRTSIFEQWEPTDLGRRAVFTLRQQRSYWEPYPLIKSHQIVALQATRLNPGNPNYDERFASYVESLTIRSPYEFEVRFSRAPLHVEALFASGSLGGAAHRGDGPSKENVPAPEASPMGQRFQLYKQDDRRQRFRRVVAEPDGVPEFHVAEIVEVKYGSHNLAVQGLLRGEVSLLPHAQSWDIPRFAADGRFFVQKYALPLTHVLQVNPKSKPLAVRELRRSLAYAIDRRRILKNTVLRDPAAARGRIVTGPFPSQSFAVSLQVKPREVDLYLAVALRFSAAQTLKQEIPNLKMIVVDDPIVRAAAAELVKAWKRIKINVTIIDAPLTRDALSSDDWDLVYHTIKMADPLVELWPLLSLDPKAQSEALNQLPELLRQELVELEASGDWNTSVKIIRRLHQHLWAEAQLLPLWEVDDYIIIRKDSIVGVPTEPMHTYQDIQRWTVKPWFAAN